MADAADPMIPSFYHNVPLPAQWVLRMFFLPLLHPDDTGRDTYLKTCVFVFFIVCIAPIGYGTVTAVTGVVPNPSAIAPWINIAGMIIATVLWAGCYVRVRMTKRISEDIVDIQSAATVLIVFSLVTTDNDINCAVCVIMASMLALIANTSRAVIFAAIYLVLMCDALYNASTISPDTQYPTLQVPGVMNRGFAVRILTSCNIVSAFVPIWLGLLMRMRSADAITRKSQASESVAKKLTAALATYNTARARDVLQDAVAEGHADENLLAQFVQLVENLDRYRPHLPNWVVVSSDSDSHCGASVTDPDLLEEVATERRSQRSDSSHSCRAEQSTHDQLHHSSLAPCPVRHLSNLVVAFVDFSHSRCDTPSVKDFQVAMDGIVSHVHQVARQTNAAVHSIVGDRLVVSWNSAVRCVQPETKAARLLVALGQDCGDWRWQATGAATCGAGLVHVAGSDGLQALTASSDCFERADVLRRQAQRRRCMLVDRKIRIESEHVMSFRPRVAYLDIDTSAPTKDRMPGSDHSSPRVPVPGVVAGESIDAVAPEAQVEVLQRRITGFEVLQEAADGDEWMYVLQNHSGNSSTLGRDCVSLLDDWEQGTLSSKTALQKLRTMIRSAETDDELCRSSCLAAARALQAEILLLLRQAATVED